MLNLSPRELIIASVKHGQPPLMVFGSDPDAFSVVPLQADSEDITEHHAHGRYCGLMGWSDGPKILFREDAGSVDIEIMRRAAVAFAAQLRLGVADAVDAGDEVAWLEALFALPDTRTEAL